MSRRWGRQVLIAIDQLINAVFAGWADETLSARAWRCRNDSKRWSIARRAIDAAFKPFQPNHCERAYINEVERKQYPHHYRGTNL